MVRGKFFRSQFSALRVQSETPAIDWSAGANAKTGEKRRPGKLLMVLIGMLALLGSRAGEASVVLPLDLKELAQKAHLIVQGVVLSTTSSWDEQGLRIFSLTRLQVHFALKGMSLVSPMVVEVRTPGGIVDEVGQKVHGAPSFRAGEEVILFLKRAKEGTLTVESLSLGKFGVYVNAGGTPMVRQETNGLHFLKKNGQLQNVPTFPSMSVADLVQQVKKALCMQKGQP